MDGDNMTGSEKRREDEEEQGQGSLSLQNLEQQRQQRKHDNDTGSTSLLLTRIRQLLKTTLTGRTEARDKAESSDYKRRRKIQKIAAASLLAIVITAYYVKSRRRQMRTASGSSNSSLWPLGLLLAWWKGPDHRRSPQESTMLLLWQAAKEGIIQQALIGSSAIYFQTKSATTQAKWNRAVLPSNNNESLKTGLLEALSQGGCTDIQALPESIWSQLSTPILTALPFVYLALLYRLMKNQFGGDDIASKASSQRKRHGDRTAFADVAGLSLVVQDMSEVVSYLSNPTLYKSMGARPPRGVLLHGPPGSGKTLLARAVAGEARCDSFTALSGSSFVEMYVGRGAARVRALFQKARRDAIRQQQLNRSASWWSSLLLGFGNSDGNDNAAAALQRPPCGIIFIDELDAVAKARSCDAIHGNDEREQTLNQLLTEMDGFDTAGDRKEEVTLIVIGASNRVDVIDEAVLRRFDRQIYVGYPDSEGRKDILLVHAQKILCASNIDWEDLASQDCTDNFSGADLRNVINEAALLAVRERMQRVEQSHLLRAAQKIRQMKARTSNNNNSNNSPGRVPLPPMFFNSID